MNITITQSFSNTRFLILSLLAFLIAPVASHANTQQSIKIGDKPLSSEQTPAATAKVDYTIQYMNKAAQEVRANKLNMAQSDLQKVDANLHQLKKFGQGMITESITVNHGAKPDQPGLIDTSDAYYSPDMQDMRLLRMAETSLKQGDSDTARREISAVRFPYVTANLELSTTESAAIAERIKLNLQQGNTYNAAFDAEEFTVDAHARAGLFNNTGPY